MRVTCEPPRMNFPHAYEDISEKSLISAFERVIAITETQEENLSKIFSRMKVRVKIEGPRANRKEILAYVDGLIKEISKKIFKISHKNVFENVFDRFFKKDSYREVAILKQIKTDLLSLSYYLKPNALMIMPPSKLKMTKGCNQFKRTFEIRKQEDMINQHPYSTMSYDHIKIVPRVSGTSALPKARSRHRTEYRAGLVPSSKRKTILGLPKGEKSTVLPSSFRSKIAQAAASESTAIGDLIQPRAGQLAPRPTRSVHPRRAGFERQLKLTEEQVRILETALRAW